MLRNVDEAVIRMGYTEYKTSPLDGDGVEKIFQKRVSDIDGTKYFITVKKWAPIKTPFQDADDRPAYKCTLQLYAKGRREPANIDFFNGWPLWKVEEYAEKIFATGLWDYYEKD